MLTNDRNNAVGDHPPPTGDFVDHPNPGADGEKVGYETTDVNVGGVVVFLGGLLGFVLIFFLFCFFMGRTINNALNKQDGPNDKWHQPASDIFAGAKTNGGKREDLKSNAAMVQQELHTMTTQFPNPRLETDDGNQDTADLHAREDLLLDHYSQVPGDKAIRIPIDRAMELIAQRQLPVAPAGQPGQRMAEDRKPEVLAPLTSGFARTGYELTTIEAREQQMSFGKASAASHAELRPVK